MYDDFKAMALRAAIAIQADGIVFTETSRDTFDKDWEELTPETRTNWNELAELIQDVLRIESTTERTSKAASQTTH